MPMQQQMSSFAARLGGRIAAANAEHRDKPIDTGNRRLPPGIRNGVAKLSSCYTKQQTEDGGMVPKGADFFRASAVVMSPESHNGERIAGMVTQVLIPLCDVPAKGLRKEKSFSENWFEFQNLFKLLGILPPPETQQTDPTGEKTQNYYFAAMRALTDPARPPVYVEFSTRGWTPKPTPAQPKPEEMVFETWHGRATPPQSGHNPAAGVSENGAAHRPPPGAPPTTDADGFPPGPPAQATAPAHPSAPPAEPPDAADEVSGLVEVAMNDPEGATEEGAAASARLEELAWAAGWTPEQTKDAEDWAAVGGMVLTPPSPPAASPAQPTTPTVGSKWKFAKRTKDGAKLKNNKGEEFPPQEVEVVSTDAAARTCTVKTARDGKPVVDLRTKEPVAVKFEWLE